MKSAIDTISLIGYGNVGSHLARHLRSAGIRTTHLYSRNLRSIEDAADELGAIAIDKFQNLPKNQLALICVTDDAIHKTIEEIDTETPIAYTSGSVELSALPERESLGVFYPLQSFSKNQDLTITEIPFLIEATNKVFAQQLFDLASRLSTKVSYADSKQRKELHLAAVWVNNFTNHIVHIAEKYAASKNLDFSLLQPLLKETIHKLDHLSAFAAQTGPARRGDAEIIDEQAMKLEGLEKEIYLLISKSIRNTYSNNEEL